jgi:serine/threonine-protein kinase RsbW
VTARSIEAPARHEQLARLAALAHAAAHEAGFSEQDACRIELAVDEACANVIDHAYRHAAGRIWLSVHVTGPQSLMVTISDTGMAFDPDLTTRPAPNTENPTAGGLGMHIIRAVMDEVRFEHGVRLENGQVGNRLTLVKTNKT